MKFAVRENSTANHLKANVGCCGVTGIIHLGVENLAEAKALLDGNPAFEAGHSIELLEEFED